LVLQVAIFAAAAASATSSLLSLQPGPKFELVWFGAQGQQAWHGYALAALPFGSDPVLGVCHSRCAAAGVPTLLYL